MESSRPTTRGSRTSRLLVATMACRRPGCQVRWGSGRRFSRCLAWRARCSPCRRGSRRHHHGWARRTSWRARTRMIDRTWGRRPEPEEGRRRNPSTTRRQVRRNCIDLLCCLCHVVRRLQQWMGCGHTARTGVIDARRDGAIDRGAWELV